MNCPNGARIDTELRRLIDAAVARRRPSETPSPETATDTRLSFRRLCLLLTAERDPSSGSAPFDSCVEMCPTGRSRGASRVELRPAWASGSREDPDEPGADGAGCAGRRLPLSAPWDVGGGEQEASGDFRKFLPELDFLLRHSELCEPLSLIETSFICRHSVSPSSPFRPGVATVG